MRRGNTVKQQISEADFDGIWHRAQSASAMVIDSETDGLNWRTNKSVGYVLTFSKAPDDSLYLPFRHGGGGNLDPRKVIRLVKDIVSLPKFRLIGFNLNFDLRMMSGDGIEAAGPLEDCQVNASLVDERQKSFSLDACCRFMNVTEKKGDDLYKHLAAKFGGEPGRKQMENFWKLSGDDPIAVDYAVGDGTSTWDLHEAQQKILDCPDSNYPEHTLRTVWSVECRVIRVLHRMTMRGIKVDEERLAQVAKLVDERYERLMGKLPKGFNAKAPTELKKLFTDAGITDFARTAKGAPSFNKDWLKTNEIGRSIIAVRKLRHLKDSFLTPIFERHLYKGRVHPNYNQARNETFGTITGRLSSNDPNMQQVHKRDEEIGSVFRSIFVPDEGQIWASGDYSQCLAAGTQVMVPGGTKNIEDMRSGDLVYSYDNRRRLVIRKVTWAGQTGVRAVNRVKWITNGRTNGYLDLTADHKIRLIDGTYKTLSELAGAKVKGYRSRYPYFIRVMALRRGKSRVGRHVDNYYRNYLYTTGTNRIPEARFVYEELNGWSPEVVHHVDENSLNDDPSNLEGMTWAEHRELHGTYGMKGLSKEERKERSMVATRALQKKFRLINNHCITHIIPLPGEQPVYDITVEGTHNFIANEICVHNCEPRLLAHYGDVKVLLDGYLSDPPVDAHTSVASAAFANGGKPTKDQRETGKRLNQALITGAGKRKAAMLLEKPMDEATRYVEDYFRRMPEIQTLQRKAANVMFQRGYVRSLLGRFARLEGHGMEYLAVNRLLQCGNADIIKLAMVNIDEFYASEGDVCALLNNVHDDLCHSFPPDCRPTFKRAVEMMEDFGPGRSVEVKVPMVVDVGEGDSWAVATYGLEKVEKVFEEWGSSYE